MSWTRHLFPVLFVTLCALPMMAFGLVLAACNTFLETWEELSLMYSNVLEKRVSDKDIGFQARGDEE